MKNRILIVEDVGHIQLIQRAIFGGGQYDTTIVGTGQEAIAKCLDADVIVLDIGLPDMDGWSVCIAIRQLEKEHKKEPVPIIAFTAHSQLTDDEQQKFTDGGFNELVVKGAPFSELRSRVDYWLAQ